MQSSAEILFRLSVSWLFCIIFCISVHKPASSICFRYKWFGSRFFDLIVSLRLANAFKQIHWFVYFSSLSFLEYSAVQNSNALLAGLLHFFVIFWLFQGGRIENIGVVDSEYVLHQGIKSLGGAAAETVSSFSNFSCTFYFVTT